VNGLRSRPELRQLEDGAHFVREVALTLARLMVYKDEYEVARLYTDPKFMQRVREQFSGDFRMTFHLAPPLLPGHEPSGRPKKRAFGRWILTLFRLLAALKGLRGTPFDPFGYTAERRMERRLIEDYRALIGGIVQRLDQATLPAAIELAQAAAGIGGYGPVKSASVSAYESKLKHLLEAFEAADQPQSRAA
jgi:indolepyruvate ferredoxin oxidoreductase